MKVLFLLYALGLFLITAFTQQQKPTGTASVDESNVEVLKKKEITHEKAVRQEMEQVESDGKDEDSYKETPAKKVLDKDSY